MIGSPNLDVSLGYSLRIEFNGLSVWKNKSDCPKCEECNRILDGSGAKYDCGDKPTPALDLTQSHDGVFVGSRGFRDFYESEDLSGLTFTEMRNGYFAIEVTRRVRFDLEKVRTLRNGLCGTCGFYRKVAVAPDPVVLEADEAPIRPNEFVASALEWGDDLARWRDLLCGSRVHDEMKRYGLRKVFFRKMGEVI